MGTRLTQFLSGEGGVGGSGGTGTPSGGSSGGGDEGDYIAGVGDNADGDGSLESGENGGPGGSGGDGESAGTVEGGEPDGSGEGDFGDTEIAGNITPVVPIIVGEDKEEEEKPQESSDAAAGETTGREEATPEPTATLEPTATPGVENEESKPHRGTLTGKLDGLTEDERNMVEELLASGKNVEIIPRSNTSKTPDFLVDGVKTELKTLNGESLNTPVKRIEDGFKQGAQVVIIDARKTELTLDQANTVIERALGKEIFKGEFPGTVEIWTNEGILRR